MISKIKFFSFFIFFLSSGFLNAYEANCRSDNGKSFSIYVKNKVLTVDGKYRHYFKSKDSSGWFFYSNDKYIYSVGPFGNGKFEIKYIDSRDNLFFGICTLIN